MNKKQLHKWHFITASAVCLFLFSVQWGVHYFLESRNARLISALFQDITMIRLQNIPKLEGDAIILGSSLTERLMASKQTAVLGVPGSPFTAGLHLLNGVVSFPAGTTYILEINNLFNEINKPLLDDTEKWNFRIFRNSRNFSIAAKPSNLLLSGIYYIARPELVQNQQIIPDTPVLQPALLETASAPTAQDLESWKNILAGIGQIRAMGGRICLVMYPTVNPEHYAESYRKACKLAKYTGLPILNYNTEYWRKKLVFTDGSHLKSQDAGTWQFRETIARDAKACAK